MAADVSYGIEFKVDDKGFVHAVDRATGKSRNLGHVLDRSKRSAKQFGKVGGESMTSFALKAASALGAVKAIRMGIEHLVKQPIQKSASLETMRLQLKQFLGSQAAARKEVAALVDFAEKTPFQLPGIVKSDRLLLSFGGTALATKDNLRLVGDAAAATGQPLDNMAFWFGRAYSAIQSGAPLGEVQMRMAEFGIAVPGLTDKLEKMRRQGKSTKEIWKLFTTQFGKTSGAMADLSKTFEGRVSTLKDTWEGFQRRIGDNGPLETARIFVDKLIGSLEKNKDAADQVGEGITKVVFTIAEFALKLQRLFFRIRQIFASVVEWIVGPFLALQFKLKEVQRSFHQFLVDMSKNASVFITGMIEKIEKAFGSTLLGKTLADQLTGGLKDAAKQFEKGIDFYEKAVARATDEMNGLELAQTNLMTTAEEYRKESEASIQESLAWSASLKKMHEEVLKQVKAQKAEAVAANGEISASAQAAMMANAANLNQMNKMLDKWAAEGKRIANEVKGNADELIHKIGMVAAAFTQGDISTEKYLATLKRLQDEYWQKENAEAISILDSLKTDGDRLLAQIEVLEAARANLANSGFTGEEVDAAVAKIREQIAGLKEETAGLGTVADYVQGAWDQMIGGIADGTFDAMSLVEGFLTQIFGNLQRMFAAQLQQKIAADSVEDGLTAKKIARNSAESGSDTTKGITGIFSWASKIPFWGVALGIALVALMLMQIRKGKKQGKQITKFAKGGEADKPTFGVFGEAGPEFLFPKKDHIAVMNDLVRTNQIKPGELRPVRRELDQIKGVASQIGRSVAPPPARLAVDAPAGSSQGNRFEAKIVHNGPMFGDDERLLDKLQDMVKIMNREQGG